MRIIKKTYSFLIIALLLTACIPAREIEELGIINVRGVDLIEEDDYRLQTTIVAYLFDKQNPNLTNTLIGKGNTIKAARSDAGRHTSFELSPGQIQLELYGKEAAKGGMLKYINPIVRDARVSDTMILAVSDTTAHEILTDGQQNVTIDIGSYLQNMIEKEVNDDSIPQSTLHTFAHFAFHEGHDPLLPLVSLTEDKVDLKGAALFQDDQYVGELPIEDAFLVNMLLKTTRGKEIEIDVPIDAFFDEIKKTSTVDEIEREEIDGDLHMNILVIEGKSDIKLTDFENLNYQIDVKMKIDLEETSLGISVENEEIAKKIEKEVKKEFEREYQSLLTKLQEVNSDPIGLGEYYRIKKPGGQISHEEWRSLFPQVTVDFNVDVELMHYGTIQ